MNPPRRGGGGYGILEHKFSLGRFPPHDRSLHIADVFAQGYRGGGLEVVVVVRGLWALQRVAP